MNRPGGTLTEDFIFTTYAGSGWNERMRIANGGNVGFGTKNPNYKLHVNGTAASTSWTNFSSREYKENIKKVDSSKHDEMLTKLMKAQQEKIKAQEERLAKLEALLNVGQ